MKSLVIFDLDGTLLNTIDDLGLAANYALEKMGYPVHPISAYPFFVGNGVGRLLERVLPEEERNAKTVEALREKFMEHYNANCAVNTRPYPGIELLLETFNKMDVRLAVASNKYQSAVTHLIHHYFPAIDWVAIEGQREGVPVKLDPSIVFSILNQYPTPKADVVYVGDSGVDMETARRACVTSVGVTWGFRPVRELREFYADHIISKPSELLTILTNS